MKGEAKVTDTALNEAFLSDVTQSKQVFLITFKRGGVVHHRFATEFEAVFRHVTSFLSMLPESEMRKGVVVEITPQRQPEEATQPAIEEAVAEAEIVEDTQG